MGNLLISELARESGFPSSTLRYYERVGLLEPAGRSAGGYRVYDDAAVERLAFISRAKRLGLELDDVRDLLALWDDGACRPVHARLQSLLDEKTALLDAQIDELGRFRTQLGHVRRSLASAEPDDRCGPGCGCDADLPDAVAVSIGRGAAGRPTCRSSARSSPRRMRERLREWQAVFDRIETRRGDSRRREVALPA